MSVLTDLIYGGTNVIAGLTERAVNDAIAKYGSEKEIAFPDTAYYFPIIYAATGLAIRTLGDLVPCVALLKSLITNQPDLGQALNAGLASAVGAEIQEGLQYLESAAPQAADAGIGFITDTAIRTQAQPLVNGRIPGIAVLLGRSDCSADVADIVRDYRSRGFMTFLVGDVIERCADGGIEMSPASRVVPLGHNANDLIHVLSLIVRSALIFGGVQPGDLAGLLDYIRDHIPAFVNTFGAIDAVVISAAAGAMAMGFPVVVDIDLADNQVPGCLESVCNHAETVQKSLSLRGIQNE